MLEGLLPVLDHGGPWVPSTATQVLTGWLGHSQVHEVSWYEVECGNGGKRKGHARSEETAIMASGGQGVKHHGQAEFELTFHQWGGIRQR